MVLVEGEICLSPKRCAAGWVTHSADACPAGCRLCSGFVDLVGIGWGENDVLKIRYIPPHTRKLPRARDMSSLMPTP